MIRRKLIWMGEPHFLGWGCSECAWVFNPLGPPSGESIEDMKQNYEQQRAQGFLGHVCADYPRSKGRR